MPPEVVKEEVEAPLLAKLLADPIEVVLPVEPVPPELPEVTGPPTRSMTPARAERGPKTLAMPRMPVLRAKGLEIGVPGVPGVPEFPEVETGLEVEAENAAPVLPVLVALPWPVTAPELPEAAVGPAVTAAEPPAPPEAWLVATLGPPVAMGLAGPVGAALTATPPGPAAATPRPPAPPPPPAAALFTALTAPPVGPDSANVSEAAPEFDRLMDCPLLFPAPVSPLGAPGASGVSAAVAGAGTVVAGAGLPELTVVGRVCGGVVWATAAPPQNTRRAAMRAPTEADTFDTCRKPGLPAFIVIPCRGVSEGQSLRATACARL